MFSSERTKTKYALVVILLFFLGYNVFNSGFNSGETKAFIDIRNTFLQPQTLEGPTNSMRQESSPSISMEKECFEQYKIESAKKKQVVGSMPWLDVETVKLLCSTLYNDSSVLEWGCGGSTIFFSRFVRKWVCVEHVPDWGQFIIKSLANETFRDKVTVNVIEPTEFYNSKIPAGANNDGNYEQFREYIEYPASLGEKFNMILDDGRARVEAAESALRNKLLEKDGVLLLHDWERKHYKILLQKGFYVVKEDKISRRHLVVLKPN